MARTRQPKVISTDVDVFSIAREVQTLRQHWLQQVPPQHGNVTLHEQDVLIVMLAGFFDPMVRSLRTIEQLAQVPLIKQHLSSKSIPKSTLADALTRFRVEHLRPLVQNLQKQLPQLQKLDSNLADVASKVVAGDGSLFRLAGEVAWALQRAKNKAGAIDSQVKLNLLLDVQRWTVENFAVSGGDHKGGEPAAIAPMLRPDTLYLFDRAYYPFEFLCHILASKADFVVRLKKDLVFRADLDQTLSEKDQQAGVQSDQLGLLGVENGRKGQPPAQTLRLVSVWDQRNKEQVRLLTNRLDLPAWAIGYLYRCRWIIELFFRWLKVTAGFSHLLSTSANGITLQFYVAMICTLLIHIRTGLPVDKYSLLALELVAQGRCRYEDQLPVLLKRQRERQRERERLAAKKAQKTEQTPPG